MSVVHFDSFESRRLFSFASADASFGKGGLLDVADPAGTFYAPAPTSITALADGRIIEKVAKNVRYLRGDGTLDTKRGTRGEVRVGSTDVIAVEASTGRVATLHQGVGGSGDLKLYNASGNLIGGFFITAEANAGPISIAFTPGGGLAVLDVRIDTHDTQHDVVAVVRLFNIATNGDVTAASGFGINGRAETTLATGLDTFDTLTPGPIYGDAQGRLYISSYLLDRASVPELEKTFSERVTRLNAGGSVDSTYGTNGVATAYTLQGQTSAGSFSFKTLDQVAAADGTLLFLTADNAGPSNGVPTRTLTLRRLSPDGVMTASAAVGRKYVAQTANDVDGRLTLAPDGTVYVATRGNGSAAMVFRYTLNNGTIKSVTGWSDFGDAVQTTQNLLPSGLSVDAKGRVLIGGLDTTATVRLYNSVIFAFNGHTTFSGVADGSASLRNDGTLVIKGTTKGDTIRLGRKKDDVTVTINGKTSSFAAVKIHGILVQSGRGDDVVDATNAGAAVYVEGGSGNDRITGSSVADDTLVGNDGTDRLNGGGGDDHLYGQDGNDSLNGEGGSDELFGGNDDDLIYGNKSDIDDAIADLYTGGKGHDHFRRSATPHPSDLDLVLDLKSGEDDLATLTFTPED